MPSVAAASLAAFCAARIGLAAAAEGAGAAPSAEDRVISWVRANDGVISESIEIVSSGRGDSAVRAVTEIVEGELIFRVPIKLHLAEDLASRDYSLPREVQKIKDLPLQHSALAAHMVREQERRRDVLSANPSFVENAHVDDFGPFWDSLDLGVLSEMPFFWDLEEREALGGAEAFDLAQSKFWFEWCHERIVSNFYRHCPPNSERWCPADIGTFERESFVRAHMFIATRTFTGRKGHHHVVPVAGLLNHAPDGTEGAYWVWDDETDSLRVWAKRNISKGEEVTISYGIRSNVLLLTVYGFTISPRVEPLFSFRAWSHHLKALLFPDLNLDALSVDVRLKTPLMAGDPDPGDALIGVRKFLAVAGVGGLERVLQHFMAAHEADPAVTPFIEQLRLNRAQRPTSHVWWTDEAENPSADTSAPEVVGGVRRSNAARLKMSEYMCLLVYREGLGLHNGTLDVASALPHAAALSAPLHAVLEESVDHTCSSADSAGGAGCSAVRFG